MTWDTIPKIYNSDGTVKHIIKEGSRRHVLSWDSDGIRCSESKCEVNRRYKNE